jgi:phage terminase large subunit
MITGPLFVELKKSDKKINVCQGGGDAGKTSDILKLLAIFSIESPNTVSTVTGQDLPNLKKGALRIFQNYIAKDECISPYIKVFNKSENTYYFKNGSLIEFTGFDDEQDARGSERDYLFINECNSRSYNLFWQLQRKTRKKVFLDYNPTSKFWVHNKLNEKSKKFEQAFSGKVKVYRTWHIHNPFLSQEDHDAYENISDPEIFRVYSRGLQGEIKGVVYKFKKADKIPEHVKEFGFGIDIGYTTDKTAIVKVWIDGRNRYYQVLLYKSENEILDEIQSKGLNITVHQYIAAIIKKHGCTPSTLVWGDHDKNYSAGLRRLSIPYRMARKGPNTVIQGISKVKECNNYYLDSPELEAELETYIWQTATDLLTGDEVSINQPIDGMPDHILAAIRYFNFSYGMRHSETD